MGKPCLIRQPSGLGDIIFTQKIAHHYLNKGYDVYWPVIDDFAWISDYLTADVFFYPKGDSDYTTNLRQNDPFYDLYQQSSLIETDEYLYLPLQRADRFYPDDKIMLAKYKLANVPYNGDWHKYFNFTRNRKKENALYYDVLGLRDEDQYSLVSCNYGSPPNFLKYETNFTSNYPIVHVDFYEHYTLFDWCKVIENATEICTIDSSINFLIDVLDTRANKLILHSRRPNNFSEVEFLFNKKYIQI